MTTVYFTHDNGGNPFKVIHDPSNHSINVFGNYEYDATTYQKNIYSNPYKKIWIGKSLMDDMTKFSGGYGKKFDGNSILVEVSENTYVFIGDKIFTFKTQYPIKKFLSPVGNSDVPYPFAIDTVNNIYLLVEDIIITPTKKNQSVFEKSENPYLKYYDLKLDYGIFQPLMKVGNEMYSFSFQIDSDKHYDLLTKKSTIPMYLYTLDNQEKKTSKEEYIEIMNKIGQQNGLHAFKNSNILVNRL